MASILAVLSVFVLVFSAVCLNVVVALILDGTSDDEWNLPREFSCMGKQKFRESQVNLKKKIFFREIEMFVVCFILPVLGNS